MANCRERPSHDEGPDTRDAREYRPRPAIRRGWQGHGRARPRAREAWDALSLPQLTAGPRGDPLAGKTREGPDHAGFPGGRRPRGDLTRAVFGVVSERTPAKARLHLPYVPGRLVPVSAPGYGSRPDLAGGLLSGAAHRMLRGIRVSSGDEPGGSCATSGGERRAGRPRAEPGPVGHRPDDRRTRRGHPPPGWGRQDKLFAGRYARRLHHRHQPRTGERQGRSLREGAQDVEPGPHHPARGAHPPGAQDHARRSELPRAREREQGTQHLRRCGPRRQEGHRLNGAGLPRRGHGGVPHRVRPLRQRARLAAGRPPTFTSTSSRPCSPRREPSRAERSCPPGKRHGIRRFPGKPTRRRLEIMAGGIKPRPLDTISDHKRGRGRC